MANELLNKEESQPMVPGIGISGTVFCPYGFTRAPCMKNGCELWVELNYGPRKVGRCAIAWNALLKTEIRAEIEKLRNDLVPKEIIPKE